ncbi:hypothetical protein HDU84_006497, partial [Entophlyctis sp. JEL0112]
RYSLLPPSNRILFFDQVQLALLEAYLEECKSAVNEFQSSFVLGPQDPAFVQRFERLTKVLRVAAAIDAILTASMDWAENILYLELLNFVQAGQRKLDGDSVNFDQSLFHVMQKAYQNVLSQIEEVAVDDCLQYIVESLWRFDQKLWNSEHVDSKQSIVSTELNETIELTERILGTFKSTLSKRVRLCARLLERPIKTFKFTRNGALELRADVEALLGAFPDVTVRQTAKAKRQDSFFPKNLWLMKWQSHFRLRDALVLLELEDNQVVELYRGLQKASVVDGTRDRDAGQGLAEDLLRDVGVRHVGVDEAAALLKRRV